MNKLQKRVVVSGVIGNALEMYDFTLYGIFSVVLSQLFFPNHDPTTSLIITLLYFLVGFLARPIGALVFGYIGDKKGRRFSLFYGILFMALATLGIGLLPTYSQIGVWAQVLLVTLRFIQGMCAGGEYIGAAIFCLEHSEKRKAGFIGSLVSVSGALGVLLSLAIGFLASQVYTQQDVWRIPFIFGVSVGILALYLRYRMPESPEFMKEKGGSVSLKEVVVSNAGSFARTIGIGSFQGIMFFGLTVYNGIFLTHNIGYPLYETMPITALGILVFLGSCPLMGWISDQVGHQRSIGIMGGIVVVCGFFVYYLFSLKELEYVILGQVIYGLLTASVAPTNAFMFKLFPARIRYTGVAVGYSIGITLFGGTMPAICTYLIRSFDTVLMPGFYVVFAGIVAIASVSVREESKSN